MSREGAREGGRVAVEGGVEGVEGVGMRGVGVVGVGVGMGMGVGVVVGVGVGVAE